MRLFHYIIACLIDVHPFLCLPPFFKSPLRILAHFNLLFYSFFSVLSRRVYCLSRTVGPEIHFAHHSLPFIVFPLTVLLKNSVVAVACKLCRQWLVLSVLSHFYKRSRSRWRLSAFPGPYVCPYDRTQIPPEGISLNFILRIVNEMFRLIPVNKIGHFT